MRLKCNLQYLKNVIWFSFVDFLSHNKIPKRLVCVQPNYHKIQTANIILKNFADEKREENYIHILVELRENDENR